MSYPADRDCQCSVKAFVGPSSPIKATGLAFEDEDTAVDSAVSYQSFWLAVNVLVAGDCCENAQ